MTDYSELLIKDCKYWSITVHENQGYLGRCVIWCKRNDALELTDATPAERKELFKILGKLRNAARAAFGPDWFNYAFLGNEVKHLHCHFIPRYARPRIVMGMEFKDELYGHNYKTDHTFATPKQILFAIKSQLQKSFTQQK